MIYPSQKLENWELRYFKTRRPDNCHHTLRVFNKNNARAKHSSLYEKKFLEGILVRDLDKIQIKQYSNMIPPGDGWHDNGCYEQDENRDNYKIILVLEEELRAQTQTQTGRWIKVVLRENTTGNYILRSIHSRDYDDHINQKSYKKSQADGWFIDDSTMAADYTFWKELKTNLGL